MSPMEKIRKFEPRTIDDSVMQDGLCAVASLQDSSLSKDLYFVVGGAATQSYLPGILRRGTCDIDLAVLNPLNRERFEGFSRCAREYLMDKGYHIDTKKGHNAFHLIYGKGDNISAVIEFARRNEANMERISSRLSRELTNARVKVIEGKNASVRVSSPEDIAVPKLVRAVGTLTRNPDFGPQMRAIGHVPVEKERDRIFDMIATLKEDLMIHPGAPEIAEHLRLVADSYDIKALSECVGFNESYFKQVVSEWNALAEETPAKRLLLESLLPKLSL